MAQGPLQPVSDSMANVMSFGDVSCNSDTMLNSASPCRMSPTELTFKDHSDLFNPQRRDRNDFMRPVFIDPFSSVLSHRRRTSAMSMETISSVQSTDTFPSLDLPPSSELASEVDDFDEDSLRCSTYSNLSSATSQEDLTAGDDTLEDFDFDTKSPPARRTSLKPVLNNASSDRLSPGGLFDDFELETTPVARGNLLRSSRYHRVNHSTSGIPSLSFSSGYFRSRSQIREQDDSGTSPQKALPQERRHSRRSTFWMPSPKVRRTQSMFATPEQMLHELNNDRMPVAATNLGELGSIDVSSGGVLESPQCPVPTFKVRQDPFPRISSETLCRLLDREFDSIYSEVLIVDCRFEYEYEGGHIRGAINVNSKAQLEQALFTNRDPVPNHRVLLVFHCEHSAYRSPMLATHLRHCDRDVNANRYPSLHYPDVAVLSGGYSDFYMFAAPRCVPQNYVEMNNQAHQRTCEREMSRFRSGMKARKFPSMGMVSAPELGLFKFPSDTQPAPAVGKAVLNRRENEAMLPIAERSASVCALPRDRRLFK